MGFKVLYILLVTVLLSPFFANSNRVYINEHGDMVLDGCEVVSVNGDGRNVVHTGNGTAIVTGTLLSVTQLGSGVLVVAGDVLGKVAQLGAGGDVIIEGRFGYRETGEEKHGIFIGKVADPKDWVHQEL